MTLQIWNYNL